MKRFSFHAYTRAGYLFLWLGTPVVFAIAAALLFTLLYFLFPTMHVNGLTAVFHRSWGACHSTWVSCADAAKDVSCV